jgi:hypothetical protein
MDIGFCSCGFVILCEFQPFGILPEIFIILGVLGAIIGFTWCALIEKRNQELIGAGRLRQC